MLLSLATKKRRRRTRMTVSAHGSAQRAATRTIWRRSSTRSSRSSSAARPGISCRIFARSKRCVHVSWGIVLFAAPPRTPPLALLTLLLSRFSPPPSLSLALSSQGLVKRDAMREYCMASGTFECGLENPDEFASSLGVFESIARHHRFDWLLETVSWMKQTGPEWGGGVVR